MVAVEVPHKPSECPVLLGRTDSKLCVKGLGNCLRAGRCFSLKGDRDVWGLGISDKAGGLEKGPPLVWNFLANEPLDVPVQQLDRRVEGDVSAALISP